MQAAAHGQLQGIAVLDIHGAQGLAGRTHGNDCSRQNAVHIEHQGAQTAEIVIDGTHNERMTSFRFYGLIPFLISMPLDNNL